MSRVVCVESLYFNILLSIVVVESGPADHRKVKADHIKVKTRAHSPTAVGAPQPALRLGYKPCMHDDVRNSRSFDHYGRKIVLLPYKNDLVPREPGRTSAHLPRLP
ncbi:hypothetical protein KSP40_PGU022161 [Platanthera guangdongensis]|uniref:Secreted protein n=1 Tax=Platanthera guangdongensis TaxID=2320717 RepID=A0ABR2MH65_9ASPA